MAVGWGRTVCVWSLRHIKLERAERLSHWSESEWQGPDKSGRGSRWDEKEGQESGEVWKRPELWAWPEVSCPWVWVSVWAWHL